MTTKKEQVTKIEICEDHDCGGFFARAYVGRATYDASFGWDEDESEITDDDARGTVEIEYRDLDVSSDCPVIRR